ncbi:MAG: hypothetical protein LBC67_01765 [Spirochaetales bacterium]|nr:hypothetical protein [Spirochaetales bacterium]
MKTLSAFCALAAFLLGLSSPLAGQTASNRYVYAFLGFTTVDTPSSEAETLDEHALSELVKLGAAKNFGIITPRNRHELRKLVKPHPAKSSHPPAEEARAAAAGHSGALGSQGLIAGFFIRGKSGYSLQFEILSPETLVVTHSARGAFQDFASVLEGAAPLVQELFNFASSAAASVSTDRASRAGADSLSPRVDSIAPPPASFSLADIAGQWKASGGAALIRINRDGSAFAEMGERRTTIALAVSLEGNRVIVRQDEPNSPRLYMHLHPYTVAVKIAKIARPLQWIFTLASDKNTLRGIEESTAVQIEGGEIVSWDNSFTQPASWLRANTAF